MSDNLIEIAKQLPDESDTEYLFRYISESIPRSYRRMYEMTALMLTGEEIDWEDEDE